jgi:hypothetical protein
MCELGSCGSREGHLLRLTANRKETSGSKMAKNSSPVERMMLSEEGL